MEPKQTTTFDDLRNLEDKMHFYRGVVWCLQQMLIGRHAEDIFKEVDPKITEIEAKAEVIKRSLNEKNII